MKSAFLIALSLLVVVAAGFGGWYAVSSILYSSSITNTEVPIITEFKVLEPVVENGCGPQGSDSFSLRAIETGTTYQAAFQVCLLDQNRCLTIASGSFNGSLDYTPLSLPGGFSFDSLPPGNYTLVASVLHGNLKSSANAYFTVVPPLALTVFGPHDVNDSSGPITVTFNASVSGGCAPFHYQWSLQSFCEPSSQNYVKGQVNGSSFNVTFSVNTLNSYYGTNQTFFIVLNVIDSLGFELSYSANSVNGYYGYQVNVTGY